MNDMIYLVVVFFIISILIEVILSRMKKKVADRLMVLLLHEDYDAFDQLINEKKTKFFVPVFNSLMLQLHKAIMVNDRNQIITISDSLQRIKMSKNQRIFFYSKVFSYYIAEKDTENIEKYYKLISECGDSFVKQYAEMVYDTLVQHGYAYLDKAKTLLEAANTEDQINLRMLIGTMYENMGDQEQAQSYFHSILDKETV